MEDLNQDPRRGRSHENILTFVELDREAQRVLAKRDYTGKTIPPSGEIVYLRAIANPSAGSTAIGITPSVYPENRAMAIRATRAVGLDVGGVDFITPDISKSYREIESANLRGQLCTEP